MQFYVFNENDNSFYVFMEQGKPVCHTTDGTLFDEDMAKKICNQLPAFKASNWRPMRVIKPSEIVAACKTFKSAAEMIGVTPSTVSAWVKRGRITLPYMRNVEKIVQPPTC